MKGRVHSCWLCVEMDNMPCEAWLRDCWLSWVMQEVPGDVVHNKPVVWLKESHHSKWLDLWPHLWVLKAEVSEVRPLHLAKITIRRRRPSLFHHLLFIPFWIGSSLWNRRFTQSESDWKRSCIVCNLLQSGFVRSSSSTALWNAKPEKSLKLC